MCVNVKFKTVYVWHISKLPLQMTDVKIRFNLGNLYLFNTEITRFGIKKNQLKQIRNSRVEVLSEMTLSIMTLKPKFFIENVQG